MSTKKDVKELPTAHEDLFTIYGLTFFFTLAAAFALAIEVLVK